MEENIDIVGFVKLPHEYFIKSKTEYREWTTAWFREALQNSLDVGSSKIRFTIVNVEESDEIMVACDDNGTGMDRDVLINKFLTMGGSQKSENSIGGFGYAKNLLAFAHNSYVITTQNSICEGVSGDYIVKRSSSFKQGVRLEVKMSRKDATVNNMTSALKEIVSHSVFREGVQIFLNGEILELDNKALKYKTSTPIGELSFEDCKDSYYYSDIWIRMNGLAMFKESVYGSDADKFKGYVDLEGHSRDVLTANRDGLQRNLSRSLNQIVNELSRDREKLKLSGEINWHFNKKDLNFYDLPYNTQKSITDAAINSGLTVDQMLQKISSGENDLADEKDSIYFDLAESIKVIKNKIDERYSRIPSHKYPVNWKVTYTSSENKGTKESEAKTIELEMKKSSVAQLAASWDFLVRSLLQCEAYREALGVIEISKGVYTHNDRVIQTGFVFGTPEGLNKHEKIDDNDPGVVSILINPTLAKQNKLEVMDVLDIAHHELSHLRYEHGESFIALDMKLRRICRSKIGNEKQIANIFKTAISKWNEYHKPNIKKFTNDCGPGVN